MNYYGLNHVLLFSPKIDLHPYLRCICFFLISDKWSLVGMAERIQEMLAAYIDITLHVGSTIPAGNLSRINNNTITCRTLDGQSEAKSWRSNPERILLSLLVLVVPLLRLQPAWVWTYSTNWYMAVFFPNPLISCVFVPTPPAIQVYYIDIKIVNVSSLFSPKRLLCLFGNTSLCIFHKNIIELSFEILM